ncbi:hypothetical protein [Nocardia heshunensis]
MRKTRRSYTPEQIAAWRAEEKATADHVDTLLSDPDAVSAMVATAVRIPCGRFLRYSLRNQALILRQAEERGFTVTDIDTAAGWRDRGRYPAQPALKISAPKGREAAPETGQDTGPVLLEIVEAGTDTNEGEGRTRFRMRKVWDISQTSGIEDFEGEPATVEPVSDPAALLWVTLCGEAERYGFTVAFTADVTATVPSVDEDRAVITVGEADRVEHLARVIGPMSADRSRAVRDPAPREYAGTAVDLGEFGTVYLTDSTDLMTARSYYTIAGKRLSGTVTVWIEDDTTATEPVCRVSVVYGEDDGTRERKWFERPNPPQVNGIAVVGGSRRIHVATFPQLGRWEANARRPISDTHTDPCPPRTTERFIAVLRAILQQFLSRPDLDQIHSAAIVVAARNRRLAQRAAAQALAAEIEKEREASAARLASLQADRDALLADAADGEDITADPRPAAAPE